MILYINIPILINSSIFFNAFFDDTCIGNLSKYNTSIDYTVLLV